MGSLSLDFHVDFSCQLSLTSVSYLSSVVSDSVTPKAVAHQTLLSMEFFRQEYKSRLSFPPPGDLPDLGTEPASLMSPASAGRFSTTLPPGKPFSFSCSTFYPASIHSQHSSLYEIVLFMYSLLVHCMSLPIKNKLSIKC